MEALELDLGISSESSSENELVITKSAITDQSSSETGLIVRRGRRPVPTSKKLQRCVYWLNAADRVAFDKLYSDVLRKRDAK